MPRHDQRVTVENTLSYEARMLVAIVLEHLNILRAKADLPPLTIEDVRAAARAHVRAHPRRETP
jgi:hypothetical protein